MKCYQFKYQNDSQNDRQPENTHLVFEGLDSDDITKLLYLVDSADNTKIYGSDDKGATWVQIDVDPSNTSGDQKSRDHNIQCAWHDRTNKIIHFGDCDNPGDDFDVWKLDYSSGFGSESITEIGTSSAYETDTVYLHDIIRYDSDTYVIVSYLDNVPQTDLFKVSSTPFSVHDTYDDDFYDKSFYIVKDDTKIYSFLQSYPFKNNINSYSLHVNNDASYGICYNSDNGHYYITDFDDKLVYEYNSSFVFQTTHSLHADQDFPWGITYDGTYFYVVERDYNNVFKYDSSWNYQTTYYINPSGFSWGITYVDPYFYMVANKIYKYDSSFNKIDEYDVLDNLDGYGICYNSDDGHFYVTTEGSILEFNSSFVLQKTHPFYFFTIGIEYNENFYCTYHNIKKILVFSLTHKIDEIEYDFDTSNASKNNIITHSKTATYSIPSDKNRRSIAYDNDDILFYVLQKISDAKYYLQSYKISTSTNTEIAKYNIALMLDRNNSGVIPNAYEKGFEIGGTKMYQIMPKTGKVFLIQDISVSPGFAEGSYIVAITDNFMFVNKP